MLSETQLPKPQLQPHQFDVAYQQKKQAEKEAETQDSMH